MKIIKPAILVIGASPIKVIFYLIIKTTSSIKILEVVVKFTIIR